MGLADFEPKEVEKGAFGIDGKFGLFGDSKLIDSEVESFSLT